MTRSFRWVPVALLLALYATLMVATNHRLTILDDEGTIITVANTSIVKTLQTFLHGTGQHEHPPLSDLILHGWLVLTHHSFAWLRIFANLFYITGLLVLAKCGEVVGNRTTAWTILLFGTAWPFGYFYARITGWYCFCFLLVSLLLYCYFSLLQQTSWPRWAAFALVAVLLIWSNYYGIAILLLLLADMLILHTPFARKQLRPLLVVCVVLVLSFLPLLPALLYDAGGTVKPASTTFTAAFAKICFMLFALIASVSVAPWFLLWSIPAGIAVAGLFITMLSIKSSRPAAIHFLLLIVGLAITSHLDLKRLLFLTPWLMLSVALCISRASGLKAQIPLAATALAFAIGWLGIATGLHPATSNFYEPWRAVAETTSHEARQGEIIISDSTTYFFYLNQVLGLNNVPAAGPYLGEALYKSRGLSVYRDAYPAGTRLASMPGLVVVRGAGVTADTQSLNATLAELRRRCTPVSLVRSTPDPGAGYKQMLDPAAPLVQFRVTLEKFDCSRAHP